MDDRARVIVSVAIVLVGIVLAVAAGSLVTEAETDQAQGTVIDFGDRETIWTDAELSQYGTELDLLIFACDHNGLSITFDDDGRITEIDGITIDVPAPNKIIVSGPDKQKVGQFAAEIREKRPPEPYKGKGIKYADEHIRRKEGKAGKGGK